MATTEQLDAVTGALDELGVPYVVLRTKGGRHPVKVEFVTWDGRTVRYPVSMTPSDRRHAANARADVRRLARPRGTGACSRSA